ncbi:MAG: DUF4118 domain-containing protein, partial [Anaerolineales bacterium]|nr:DUF4118 domain-containing protein [Anaerolineales bacterium]
MKIPHKPDPTEWVMILLSWMIYLGGLFFFSDIDNAWLLMALGALPVLVTAWSLGMSIGAGSAAISIGIHLLVHFLFPHNIQQLSVMLLEHLIGFALLAVMGMFVGHLHDLQVKSRLELLSLVENNQKLIQLSRGLEATNQLTTELITTQEWLDKIPDLLRKIGAAAAIDHLFLLQLTGNGTINHTGKIHHFWYEIQSQYPTDTSSGIPRALLPWIETAQNNIPVSGILDNLPGEMRDYFAFKDSGEYAVF